jgi:hypothetical protein
MAILSLGKAKFPIQQRQLMQMSRGSFLSCRKLKQKKKPARLNNNAHPSIHI